MSRDARLFLEDILESCGRILAYTKGMEREAFVKDTRTYDAVVRNLEIVGEAAKRLPDELKDVFRAVEWRKISGLRDLLAHAYFGIDDDILWDIVTNKIPALRGEVETYLSSH